MRYFFFLSIFIQILPAQQAIQVNNAASLGFGSAPRNSFAPGSLIQVALNPVAITGAVVPIDPSTVTIQIQPAGTAVVVGSANGFGVVARLFNDIPLGPATLTMSFNGQTSAAGPDFYRVEQLRNVYARKRSRARARAERAHQARAAG